MGYKNAQPLHTHKHHSSILLVHVSLIYDNMVFKFQANSSDYSIEQAPCALSVDHCSNKYKILSVQLPSSLVQSYSGKVCG